MGGDPTDGPHPGEFSPQVRYKAFRDATIEMNGWEPCIPPYGIFHAGGGDGYNGYAHLHIIECGHKVHCDATYSRPVSGGGAEARIAGPQAVMGTGGMEFTGLGEAAGDYSYRDRGRTREGERYLEGGGGGGDDGTE